MYQKWKRKGKQLNSTLSLVVQDCKYNLEKYENFLTLIIQQISSKA